MSFLDNLSKNQKIIAGVVLVALVAVIGYFIWKRMKKEGFQNPLTGAVNNIQYDDFGVMAGGSGDEYASLAAQQPGAVNQLYSQGYMTPPLRLLVV